MDLTFFAVASIIILILSAVIHEYAHGAMADWLGDPTAKYAGRLTVNPIPHIDLWGTVLMPLTLLILTRGSFLFAYAKPVPYNPYNLRNQKWGPSLVAIAGPMANFLLAIAFALVYRLMPLSDFSTIIASIVRLNIMLMVFNLVPIPPLDGSKILYALLPDSARNIKFFLDKYGFAILLFFIFFLFETISPIINGIFNLFVG